MQAHTISPSGAMPFMPHRQSSKSRNSSRNSSRGSSHQSSRKSSGTWEHRSYGSPYDRDQFVLQRLDRLSEDVSGLKTGFHAMTVRMDRIETRMDRLEDKVDTSFETLSEKIDALGRKMDERIEALDRKMDQKIDALGGKMDQKIDVLGGKVDKALETQAFQRGAGWVIGFLLVGMLSTLGWVGARVMDRTSITFALPTESQHAMATPTPEVP